MFVSVDGVDGVDMNALYRTQAKQIHEQNHQLIRLT